MISSKQKVFQRIKMNVCSPVWSQGGSTVSQSARGVGNTKLVKGSMAEQVSKHPGNILRHPRVFFLIYHTQEQKSHMILTENVDCDSLNVHYSKYREQYLVCDQCFKLQTKKK